MWNRSVRLLLTLVALTPTCGGALADNKKPPAPVTDAELLEFLGSVDAAADPQGADDGSWIEYLSQTDISKVAKTADPSAGARPKPVATVPPPATGDKKDD